MYRFVSCCDGIRPVSFVFQAAAISGIISRFIFINPSWDKPDDMAKFASMVEVGTIQLRGVDRPVFCGCAIDPKQQKRICTYEKEDAPANSGDKDDDNGDDNFDDNDDDNVDDNDGGDNDDDKGGDNGDGDNDDDKGGDDNDGGNDDNDIIIENQEDCKVRKSTLFSLNM